MKALIMAAPAADGSTTSVADIDEPQPGPGQVAIYVAYAGVNFIDVMARRGDPGYASAWPYVPGLEIAGTIRSVGSGVHDLHVGERVAAFTPGGGLAEVAVAAADVTVEVPPDVPLATAAAAPLVVSTALLLLTDRARIRPGESVLMHSASGGIGSVVSQVAAALGAGRRIGTVGRPDKIAAGLAAGWDEVFAREAGLAEAVRTVAPEGVDVILDPVGTALLDLDLSISAPGGRVVLFGNAAGGAQPPLPPAGRLIGGNVGVLGFSISLAERGRPESRGQRPGGRAGDDRRRPDPARAHDHRTARIGGRDPRPARRRPRQRQVCRQSVWLARAACCDRPDRPRLTARRPHRSERSTTAGTGIGPAIGQRRQAGYTSPLVNGQFGLGNRIRSGVGPSRQTQFIPAHPQAALPCRDRHLAWDQRPRSRGRIVLVFLAAGKEAEAMPWDRPAGS